MTEPKPVAQKPEWIATALNRFSPTITPTPGSCSLSGGPVTEVQITAGTPAMRMDPAGSWVSYEQHQAVVAALQAQVAERDAEIARLRGAILALNSGWNAKEPEHLISERIDFLRRLAARKEQP